MKANVRRTTARPLDHLATTSVHSSEFSCGKGIASVHTSRPFWPRHSRGTRRPNRSTRAVKLVPGRNHTSTFASRGTDRRIVSSKLPGSSILVSSHSAGALRPNRMIWRWRPASQRGGDDAIGVGAVVASDSGELAGSVAPVVPSGRNARKASSEAAAAIAMSATTSTNVTIFRTRTHCTTLAGWPAAALPQAFRVPT